MSGNLEFASGGIGPLLTIWAKTHDTIKVKAVGTLNAMPMWLTTTNPDVRTIRDFTDKDRIALPAVKVSAQAVILQMAAVLKAAVSQVLLPRADGSGLVAAREIMLMNPAVEAAIRDDLNRWAQVVREANIKAE